MCVWYVYLNAACRDQKRVLVSLGAGVTGSVTHPSWVLGTELQVST